jgi:hypothetical protein
MESEITCYVGIKSGETQLQRLCCSSNPLKICRISASVMTIFVIITIWIVGVFLIRKIHQLSKINSIVYVTQILILLSYLCKPLINHGYIARLVYFLDMSFWNLNKCAFNLFEFLPLIFSSMAYFTYIGNWLSLTLALSASSVRTATFKQSFLRWFRPGLYCVIVLYFALSMAFILSHCHSRIPISLTYAIQIFQSIVLIVAVIIGPLILVLLRTTSKYLY